MNPNCYTCRHRRPVPGDAHSGCAHPLMTETDAGTQALAAVAVMQFGGFSTEYLTVRFEPHGVANGWALYPWNFDPIWLRECSGHLAIATAAA